MYPPINNLEPGITSLMKHIESAGTSLWFVGYSNRIADALWLFWFWMKQWQYGGAAVFFKIIDDEI
jgi:hypothetical protein